MLPFKTSDKTENNYTIDDGFGNSLTLPKYGCVTVNEALAVGKIDFENRSYVDYKLAKITAFLKARFRLETLTEQEVAEQAQTQPMLDAIYEFMNRELLRWPPETVLLTASGEAARIVAKTAAKTLGGVAAYDERYKEVWYVFATLKDVPESYLYVDEDVHCAKDVLPALTGGKD